MEQEQLAEYFAYLDELRASGSVNMMGAGVYVEAEFDVDRDVARKALCMWMETFNQTTTPDERATKAIADEKIASGATP